MKTYATCDTCGKDLQCDEASGFGDDYYYSDGKRHCRECNFKTPQGFIKQLEGMIDTMAEIIDIRKNLQSLLDQVKELELDQAKDRAQKPGTIKVPATQDGEAPRWRELYQQETKELRLRIRELENQIVGLGNDPAKSDVDIGRVDVRTDDLNAEIKHKDREIEALRSSKQDLQKEVDEYAAMNSKKFTVIKNLNTRIESLEKRNYPAQIEKLEAKIRDLGMQVDQYDITLKEQRREIGKLEARLKSSQ